MNFGGSGRREKGENRLEGGRIVKERKRGSKRKREGME